MLSAASDEAVRLLLTDPERYPVERLLANAGWALDVLSGGDEPLSARR